jgi:hypothetical protein
VNALARIVSFLFHPLLMASYLFTLLAWTLPAALAPIQTKDHANFLLLIFMVTFLLPVVILGIFKTFGTIQSFQMVERKERILPFIFITFIYLSITYLLYSKTRMGLQDNFLKLMIIIDLLMLTATITTFFFKVSVHSIGIWGLVGITLPLTKISEVNSLFYASIVMILLAGIIMSSRLQVGAHTSREVMLGSVLGLAASLTGMLILFSNTFS